jgi:hypothetical protein
VTSPIKILLKGLVGLILLQSMMYIMSYQTSTNIVTVIPQADLPTSDINTDLVAATQPVGPFDIPSTATDAGRCGKCVQFPDQ